MTPVTEQQFFASLTADKRDIMPSIADRNAASGYVTRWVAVRSGAVFGRSKWRDNKGATERWFLVENQT